MPSTSVTAATFSQKPPYRLEPGPKPPAATKPATEGPAWPSFTTGTVKPWRSTTSRTSQSTAPPPAVTVPSASKRTSPSRSVRRRSSPAPGSDAPFRPCPWPRIRTGTPCRWAVPRASASSAEEAGAISAEAFRALLQAAVMGYRAGDHACGANAEKISRSCCGRCTARGYHVDGIQRKRRQSAWRGIAATPNGDWFASATRRAPTSRAQSTSSDTPQQRSSLRDKSKFHLRLPAAGEHDGCTFLRDGARGNPPWQAKRR